jgi:anti-sigma28 factor (negative regulator of flagellin synthesis)
LTARNRLAFLTGGKMNKTKKIEKITKQIKEGTYLIDPERIARKMIARTLGPFKPLP